MVTTEMYKVSHSFLPHHINEENYIINEHSYNIKKHCMSYQFLVKPAYQSLVGELNLEQSRDIFRNIYKK